LDLLKKKISYQEKILTALGMLKSSISDENGVCDILSSVIKNINKITDIHNH
jgi:hypothetical protein